MNSRNISRQESNIRALRERLRTILDRETKSVESKRKSIHAREEHLSQVKSAFTEWMGANAAYAQVLNIVRDEHAKKSRSLIQSKRDLRMSENRYLSENEKAQKMLDA